MAPAEIPYRARSAESGARPTASDVVAAYICEQIWAGQLRPGQRVPQAEIAASLGMSATPVREAIAVLAQQGRIELINHRGAFIGPFDEEYLLEHYALRGVIYGWAAARCSKHVSSSESEHFLSLADQVDRAATAQELYDAAIRIHQATITSGAKSLRQLRQVLMGVVPGDVYSFVPAAFEPNQRDAAAIARAVASGKGDRAAEICRRMFESLGRYVVDQLRHDGVLAT